MEVGPCHRVVSVNKKLHFTSSPSTDMQQRRHTTRGNPEINPFLGEREGRGVLEYQHFPQFFQATETVICPDRKGPKDTQFWQKSRARSVELPSEVYDVLFDRRCGQELKEGTDLSRSGIICESVTVHNSCCRSYAHEQSLLCLQLRADEAQWSIQWKMTLQPRLCVKTAGNSDKSYSIAL